MKARVKATGEIVEVVLNGIYYDTTDGKERFYHYELDFNDTTDYWTRLEHQYAGMAMQGLLTNTALAKLLYDDNASIKDKTRVFSEWAKMYAHALVEKMKEERK